MWTTPVSLGLRKCWFVLGWLAKRSTDSLSRWLDSMKSICLVLSLLLTSASSCLRLEAQEADFGVSVPLTITGGLLETDRAKSTDPSAASLTVGFRALVMPQLKLGSNWF